MTIMLSAITETISDPISAPKEKTLYLHSELEILIPKLSDWKQKAWKEFSEKISDPDFPCLFGKRAWGSKSIRVIFCDKQEDDGYFDFFYGLISYTNYVNSVALNKRLFSPLVVFFSPDFTQDQYQHETGWEAIKWVSLRDVAPWAENVPSDPESPEWSFSFNSIPLFINMSTKDHKVLRNRNLGSHLTFVINARENFDAVANGQTKGGRLARERIRKRVKKYNNGAVPSELGFYGEEDNLEWKQYQLSEEGLERPSKCPFSSES